MLQYNRFNCFSTMEYHKLLDAKSCACSWQSQTRWQCEQALIVTAFHEPKDDHSMSLLRPQNERTTTALRPQNERTTTTLRPHYDNITNALRPLNDRTTTTERPHYDHTTTALRPHYDRTANTLRPHYDRTSIVLQTQLAASICGDSFCLGLSCLGLANCREVKLSWGKSYLGITVSG